MLKILSDQAQVYAINAMQPLSTQTYKAECQFAEAALDIVASRVREGRKGGRGKKS